MDLSFSAVAEAFKPGVTECELWGVAEHEILRHGGWYAHFFLGTSGPAPTFHRSPPSMSPLSKGDMVSFEINVTYGGVSPQISYTLSLGHPRKDIEEMFKICDELYKIEFEELEKKKSFMEVEKEIIRRIHDAGYLPMTPQLHIYNMSTTMPMEQPALAGDYFTVHPSIITRDYTAAAKFGDVVRMNSNGKLERLNRTPAKLNIV
jgi:Xaa-Pro aminopeptidase